MKQGLQRFALRARGVQAVFACAFSAAAALGGTALLTATPAAAELVTNGGFEDRSMGDFTGWVQPSLLDFTSVQCPGPSSADPLVPAAPEGDCYARFGAPIGGAGTIAQGLNTDPGSNYRISFMYDSDGNTPNLLSVTFGGATLLSLMDIADTPGFVTRSFVAQATDPITTLSFDLHNNVGYLYLDAVSVTAAATVPEPGALALTALALAGLALSRRSRRDGILPPEE
jgi:PEP-CTERM motif-containing protein